MKKWMPTATTMLFLVTPASWVFSQPKILWHANLKIPLGPVYSLHFQDSLAGWAAGTSIHTTRDGGKSWEKTWNSVKVGDTLSHITFPTPNTGYAVGQGGLALRSQDSGNSWYSMDVGTSRNLRRSQFVSEQRGWIWGGGPDGGAGSALWETQNGGETWELRSTHPWTWNDFTMVDGELGFAVGTRGLNGYVLKTRDGGISWQEVTGNHFIGSRSATDDPITLTGVVFLDSAIGFVSTSETRYSSGKIYRTLDGGITWSGVWSGVSMTGMMQLEFRERQLSAIPYDGNYINLSSDTGKTWSQKANSFRISTYSTPIPGAIFAWGQNSLLYKSVNGSPWMQVYTPDDRIQRIVPDLNGSIWVAAGDSAYRSEDGGETWRAVHRGGQEIRLAGKDTAWILPNLRSIDGGKTWEELPVPCVQGECRDLLFYSGTIGWSLNKSGTALAQTLDGGLSWVDQSSEFQPNTLLAISFVDSQRGWSIGRRNFSTDNYLIYTVSGGKEWKSLPIWDLPSHMNLIQFNEEGTGWVAGDSKFIARSSDGGNTWTQIPTPVLVGIDDFRFLNGHQGYIRDRDNGRLFLTENAGETWDQVTGLDFRPTATAFAGDTALWVGGIDGQLAILPFKVVEPPTSIQSGRRGRIKFNKHPQVRDFLGRLISNPAAPTRFRVVKPLVK